MTDNNPSLLMTDVLISLCNFAHPNFFVLLRYTVESKALTPIKIESFPMVSSCTGLVTTGTKIYALIYTEDMRLHLVVLQKNDFSLIFWQALPEVKDAHSLMVTDGFMFIVSTGTDEVVRYELESERISNPNVIWQASRTGTDTHHLNSIVNWRGNIVISAFGEKLGPLWSSATEGYIHNIDHDQRIKEHIHHPHTLTVQEEQLYYCESHRKLFCSLEKPIFSLGSYTRGVCWLAKELVCIGNSMGRQVSKSTGQIANPADPGEPTGSCEVVVGNIYTGEILERINIEQFHSEIYDLSTTHA